MKRIMVVIFLLLSMLVFGEISISEAEMMSIYNSGTPISDIANNINLTPGDNYAIPDLTIPTSHYRHHSSPISQENAIQLAANYLKRYYDVTGTLLSIIPLEDFKGELVAYDLNFSLHNKSYESYSDIYREWEKYNQANNDKVLGLPGDNESPFAFITVAANFDNHPVIASALSLSPFYTMGWRADFVARQTIGYPQIERIIYGGALIREIVFSDGQSSVTVSSYPPYNHYETSAFVELVLGNEKRFMDKLQELYENNDIDIEQLEREERDEYLQDYHELMNGAVRYLGLTGNFIDEPQLFKPLSWTYGCTPTSGGMIAKYWNNMGYGRLSEYFRTGTHVIDNTTNRHATQAEFELKDHMDTSSSGSTHPHDIRPGLSSYFDSKDYDRSSDSTIGWPWNYRWNVISSTIRAGRPFVFSYGSYHNQSGHSVACFGYRYSNKRLYIYETWTNAIHSIYYKAGTVTQIDRIRPTDPEQKGEIKLTNFQGYNSWGYYELGSDDEPRYWAYADYEITWNSSDIPGSTVSVWLLDETSGFLSEIDSGLPNNGSYIWTPDGINIQIGYTKRFRIVLKLFDAENNYVASDGSRGRFIIRHKPVTLTINSENPETGVEVFYEQTGDGQVSQSALTEFEIETYVSDNNRYLDIETAEVRTVGDYREKAFNRWVDNLGFVSEEANTTYYVDFDSEYLKAIFYNRVNVLSSSPHTGIIISCTDNNGEVTEITTPGYIDYPVDAITIDLTAPQYCPVTNNFFLRWEVNDEMYSTSRIITGLSVEEPLKVVAIYDNIRNIFIRSENPASMVPIIVSPADFGGNTDGNTEFLRRYNRGTEITLQAPAEHGEHNFDNWYINNSPAQPSQVDGSTLTYDITDDQYHFLTARYLNPLATVNVSSQNADNILIDCSEDVNSAGEGITPFERIYHTGSSVMFIAPWQTDDDEWFSHWIKDDEFYSDEAQIIFDLEGDTSLIAVYHGDIMTINIESQNPEEGVFMVLSAFDVSGQHNGVTPFTRGYNAGQLLWITAPETADGYYFERWEKNEVNVGGHLQMPQTLVTNVEGNDTYTAVYSTVPAYCIPVYNTDPVTSWYIDSVIMGDINNTDSGGAGGAVYNDYTNEFATELVRGEEYTISIKNDSFDTVSLGAWIDFNRNSSFDIQTETIVWDNNMLPAETTDYTFTVPNDAELGNTRMRVRLVYGSTLDPCDSASAGETEDYTVIIVDEPTYTVTELPFEENFVSDTLPDHWQNVALEDISPNWDLDNASAYSGNYSLSHGFDYHSMSDNWVILPRIYSENGLRLTFREKNEWMDDFYTHHGVWISVGSDNPLHQNFVLLEEFDQAASSWTERNLLIEHQGQNVYIAFRYWGQNGATWSIDDIVVDEMPEFLPPTDLTTNVTEDGIGLEWLTPNMPSNDITLIGYNLYRNSLKLNDTVLAGSYYLDEDVQFGATYSYYVTSQYEIRESEPSNIIDCHFVYETEISSLPYLLDFSGPFPPHGWTFENIPMESRSRGNIIRELSGEHGGSRFTNNWNLSNTAHAGGEIPELRFHWSPQFTGKSYFMSPGIVMQDRDAIFVSFDYTLKHHSGYYQIGLDIQSANGEWHNVWHQDSINEDIIEENVWLYIPKPEEHGDIISLGLYYEGFSMNIQRINFDNIELIDAPLLLPPTNFAGVSGDGSVILSWDLPAYEQGLPDDVELIGYNLYRDGELLNQEPLLVFEYNDLMLNNGQEYEYEILTVYNYGSSPYAEPVIISPEGGHIIYQLPYLQDFSGDFLPTGWTVDQTAYNRGLLNASDGLRQSTRETGNWELEAIGNIAGGEPPQVWFSYLPNFYGQSYLILPRFHKGNVNHIKVSFKGYLDVFFDDIPFIVSLVVKDNDENWAEIWSVSNANFSGQDDFSVFYNCLDHSSEYLELAFLVDGWNTGAQWWMDDVQIEAVDDVQILPPANLAAFNNYNSIELVWFESESDLFTSFDIYRDDVLIASVSDNLSFYDLDVTAGVEYTYHLRAVHSNYESPISTIAQITFNPTEVVDIPYYQNFEGDFSLEESYIYSLARESNANNGYNNWTLSDSTAAGNDPPELAFTQSPIFYGRTIFALPFINNQNQDAIVLSYSYFIHLTQFHNIEGLETVYRYPDSEWNMLETYHNQGIYMMGKATHLIEIFNDDLIQFGFLFEGQSSEIISWQLDNISIETYEEYPSPNNLISYPYDNRVTLLWERPIFQIENSQIEQELLGYDIYRNDVKLNNSPLTEIIYIDNQVENNITYNYYVTAVYGDGESEASNIVQSVPYLPDPITNYPYTENFETDVFPPLNWYVYQTGFANPGWLSAAEQNPVNTYSYHHYTQENEVVEDWLVLPKIVSEAAIVFKFKEISKVDWEHHSYHGMWISENSGDPEDGDFYELEVFAENTYELGIGYIWVEREIIIMSESSEFYIAFKYAGDEGVEWQIDDIEIDQIFHLPPQNLTAESGDSSVQLSWLSPLTFPNSSSREETLKSLNQPNQNHRDFIGYNVYRDNTQINPEVVSSDEYLDSDVVNGISYEYYVTAVYDDGESDASNTAVAIPYGNEPIAIQPALGDGSANNPYEIANLGNLYWIAEHFSRWNLHYIQTADIDASVTTHWFDSAGWSPIGDNTTRFTGSYNGQGYIIDALSINRSTSSNIGLFGRTDDAVIQNVGLRNVNITGGNSVGALVGMISNGSLINKSYSSGSVNGDMYVGGLVGYNYESSHIINSYSTASITGSNSVGGIVGYNTTYASVNYCYSIGGVNGPANTTGGLVGQNVSGAYVINSYYNEETSGQTDTGKGEPRTTAEMKHPHAINTYESWDFVVIWQEDQYEWTNGYPYLINQINYLPPPINLTGTPEGSDMLLSWDSQAIRFGDDLRTESDDSILDQHSTPVRNNRIIPRDNYWHNSFLGYNVYRNGIRINSDFILETNYQDTYLTIGNYQYYVKAVFFQGESQASNMIEHSIDPFNLPFSENFDADVTLPDFWEIVDHQSNGQVWQFGTVTNGLSGTTGNYAYLDSHGYGEGNTQNTDLITPTIDMSNYDDISLSFTHYFRQYLDVSSVTLSYSIDDGESWTTIQTWTESTTNPCYFNQTIPQIAGQSQVKFKWNYTGTWGFYWCVDDIFVSVAPTDLSAIAGDGLVELSWNAPATTRGEGMRHASIVDLANVNRDDIDLLGYDIYRDGEVINQVLVTETNYTDNVVQNMEIYNYYVKAVYEYGETAASNTVQAIPESIVIDVLPFMEDFTGVDIGSVPQGWYRTHLNWEVYDPHYNGSDEREMRFSNSYIDDTIFRLITPRIVVSDVNELRLTFKHLFDEYPNTTNDYIMSVQISPDRMNWTPVWSVNTPGDIPQESLDILLDTLDQDNLYISWVYEGSSYDVSLWSLDDIVIEEVTGLPWNEDFTGVGEGHIPSGWQSSHNNWRVPETSNHAGGTPPEMFFASEPSMTGEGRLTSPKIVLNDYSDLLLTFKHFVNDSSSPVGGYELSLQISHDLSNWDTVWSITPDGDVNPETIEILIYGLQQHELYLSWVYDGVSSDINYWAIDDIVLDKYVTNLPWSEDFTGITHGSIPSRWQRTHESWKAVYDYSAGGTAPEMRFVETETGLFRLITPQFNMIDPDEMILSFKHRVHQPSSSRDFTLSVEISTDMENWTTLWSLISPYTTAGTIEIITEHLNQNNFYLSWVFEGNSSHLNWWAIDDIVLEEYIAPPPVLYPPENLTVEIVNNQSLLLQWDAPQGENLARNEGQRDRSLGSISNRNEIDTRSRRNDFTLTDLTGSQRPSQRGLIGYNVYRDGEIINNELISEIQYIDNNVVYGETYQYYVTAVYEDGESAPSNTVEIYVPDKVAIPSYTPEPGLYPNTIDVSIESTTQGATIMCRSMVVGNTRDSWSDWQVYTDPITVPMDTEMNFEAYAEKDDWITSDTAAASYTVTNPPLPAIAVYPLPDVWNIPIEAMVFGWSYDEDGTTPDGYMFKYWQDGQAQPEMIDVSAETIHTIMGVLDYDKVYNWQVIPYINATVGGQLNGSQYGKQISSYRHNEEIRSGDKYLAVDCPIWSFTTIMEPIEIPANGQHNMPDLGITIHTTELITVVALNPIIADQLPIELDQTFSFSVNGSGIVTITVTTTAQMGYYYFNNSWNPDPSGFPNVDGEISFSINFNASRSNEASLLVGNESDPDPPLPVTLNWFEVEYLDNQAVLSWQTASETNNMGWKAYRSQNSLEPDLLLNTEFIAGAGTTTQNTDYNYCDPYALLMGNTYFYWIESVEFDGTTELFGPVTLEVPIEGEVPLITKLLSNHPNPFNPNTNISFDVRAGETGILEIYDVRGRKLESHEFSAGSHNYLWQAEGKSSGIYFYRLKSESYRETKKMLLLK